MLKLLMIAGVYAIHIAVKSMTPFKVAFWNLNFFEL